MLKKLFLIFLLSFICLTAAFSCKVAVAATAFETLVMAADQGDPVAQYMLGEAYKGGGYGLAQDYDEAEKWFRKSAEQGYAPLASRH